MKKYDSLLKRAEEFEKLAVYGDRTTFLQAIGQADPSWANIQQKVDEEADWSKPTTIPPPPPVVAKPPHFTTEEESKSLPVQKAPAPTVSKETQDQLNQILVPYGKILPIKVDGVLGPETQKAINEFKKTYSKPGTAAAIKEVYLQVKNPGLVTKAPF